MLLALQQAQDIRVDKQLLAPGFLLAKQAEVDQLLEANRRRPPLRDTFHDEVPDTAAGLPGMF
ncbi:MAG: hypothetical protein KF907_00605 [Dokdonella sp.]|nr:hypothetical protein [Dokdonella sp.]MBX3690656.1 hypothetical protein [Dokdonella sp.]MCW5567550.1 hypothetical protein [Dokdonella sp.]